jgi:hypothetical protein
VPAGRHFPDGFRIVCGDLTLAFALKSPTGFEVVADSATIPASAFHWDVERNRLLVDSWGSASGETTLKILPGLHG